MLLLKLLSTHYNFFQHFNSFIYRQWFFAAFPLQLFWKSLPVYKAIKKIIAVVKQVVVFMYDNCVLCSFSRIARGPLQPEKWSSWNRNGWSWFFCYLRKVLNSSPAKFHGFLSSCKRCLRMIVRPILASLAVLNTVETLALFHNSFFGSPVCILNSWVTQKHIRV